MYSVVVPARLDDETWNKCGVFSRTPKRPGSQEDWKDRIVEFSIIPEGDKNILNVLHTGDKSVFNFENLEDAEHCLNGRPNHSYNAFGGWLIHNKKVIESAPLNTNAVYSNYYEMVRDQLETIMYESIVFSKQFADRKYNPAVYEFIEEKLQNISINEETKRNLIGSAQNRYPGEFFNSDFVEHANECIGDCIERHPDQLKWDEGSPPVTSAEYMQKKATEFNSSKKIELSI